MGNPSPIFPHLVLGQHCVLDYPPHILHSARNCRTQPVWRGPAAASAGYRRIRLPTSRPYLRSSATNERIWNIRPTAASNALISQSNLRFRRAPILHPMRDAVAAGCTVLHPVRHCNVTSEPRRGINSVELTGIRRLGNEPDKGDHFGIS